MSMLPTGLYQPGKTVLHRLCPWVKLLCLIVLLVAVVCTDTFYGYGTVAVLTAVLILLSRMRLWDVLSSVRRMRWFFLILFVMNLCLFAPQDPWAKWWIFAPSHAGMIQGIHVVARMLILMVLSNLLIMTTSPLAMTDAFQVLLLPLKIFFLPVGQIAMILSVALQFIPTLFEEADAIRKAQTARGAGFDSKKLRHKAAAVLPLAVPIFLAAFKRADELSLAMEARGYQPGKGIKRRKYPLGVKDFAAIVLCAAICAVHIVML